MMQGICITIGVIFIIASRFLYGIYDITLGGDTGNTFTGGMALFTDILGTVMVVFSILSYTGIYHIFG